MITSVRHGKALMPEKDHLVVDTIKKELADANTLISKELADSNTLISKELSDSNLLLANTTKASAELLAETTQASAELLAKITQATAEQIRMSNEISTRLMNRLTIILVAVGVIQIILSAVMMTLQFKQYSSHL